MVKVKVNMPDSASGRVGRRGASKLEVGDDQKISHRKHQAAQPRVDNQQPMAKTKDKQLKKTTASELEEHRGNGVGNGVSGAYKRRRIGADTIEQLPLKNISPSLKKKSPNRVVLGQIGKKKSPLVAKKRKQPEQEQKTEVEAEVENEESSLPSGFDSIELAFSDSDSENDDDVNRGESKKPGTRTTTPLPSPVKERAKTKSQQSQEEQHQKLGRGRPLVAKPTTTTIAAAADTVGASPAKSKGKSSAPTSKAFAVDTNKTSFKAVAAPTKAAAYKSNPAPSAPTATVATKKVAKDTTAAAAIPRLETSAPIHQARNYLLKRLSDPRSKEAATIPLRSGLQKACEKLSTALDSTVRLGHSNSLLVLGPRGSGKTLAVERAVSTLTQRYNTNPKDPLVGVVRLVGWAHSDDKTAFKEVARQLCEAFQYTFHKSASLGDNIDFLRTMLTSLARAHKVAVFILDEFDAFARKTKQSLLYCLLDALQTSGVQAAVVGITTRHDCMDLMEKRVRSRFSHRTIDVWLPRGALSVAPPQDNNDANVEATDAALDVLQAMLTLPDSFTAADAAFRKAHNAAVAAALKREDSLNALKRWCASHPSLRQLASLAQLALAATAIAPNGKFPPAAIVAACTALSAADDGAVSTIISLSVLELAMLVAAFRAASRHEMGPINYEMSYHQFKAFAQGGGEGHVDTYSAVAASKAFDRLLALGLLTLVDARSEFRVGSRQYAPVYVQVHEEELKVGLGQHAYCSSRLRNWFAREGGQGATAAAML